MRAAHAAPNLAVLRHSALTLLRQERTARIGVKAKRLKAGWDHRYLLKVLAAYFRCDCPACRLICLCYFGAHP